MDRQADEQQIRALWERLADGWTRNDATAYAAEFTEDSDYVAFDGTWLRGRSENEALHRKLFETVLSGTRLEGEVEAVRFLSPDIAVAHLRGAVLFAWQPQPAAAKRRLSRQTIVVVRTGDRWQVAAFHNTRLRPLPLDGPGVKLAGTYLRWRTARTLPRGRSPQCGG